MIDITPSPIAFSLGPIAFPWYGIGYAVGLFLAAWVCMREAKRRGLDPNIVPNGLIVIAVAALIGGRLYHVIDQWALYKDDLLKIVLPPYSGLGAYGGLITGIVALFLYTRYKKLEFWTWMDIAAPAVFVMQGVARWGNFFNQELYGPPTNLPWGIAIDCAHRVAEYACPPGSLPTDTLGQHFHPMFLYESLSGLAGALTLLWLARRYGDRLRPGDLAMIFIIWYSTVRFGLEYLRAGYNWTFFGVPTAQVVAGVFMLAAVAVLVWRHRPGAAAAERAEAAAREQAAAEARAEETAGESADGSPRGGGRRPGGGGRRGRTAAVGIGRRVGATGLSGQPRRRPQAARVSPEALARQRGGVREGLEWLGHPPQVRAGVFYRLLGRLVRFVAFVLLRFRIDAQGREHLGPLGSTGGYLLVGAVHRGWMDPFLVLHALPMQPRPWFLGSGAAAFDHRWKEFLLRRVGGILPVWRGGVGIEQHLASAHAVLAAGGVFVLFPEGGIAGPIGELSTFRLGAALIALRTSAPIVPLVMVGSEELYVGRRMATRILAPTSAAALLGEPADWVAPAPGSREELDVARRLTEQFEAILGPEVRAMTPAVVDPPSRPRRLRGLTWLLISRKGPGPGNAA